MLSEPERANRSRWFKKIVAAEQLGGVSLTQEMMARCDAYFRQFKTTTRW